MHSAASLLHRRARLAATLGFLTGLAACVVGPHYVAPDAGHEAPAGYSTHDAGLSADAPPDRWWLALGDSTLTSLIERALSDNPDLASAEARVQQARALARVAGAEFYPSLNADGRVSRDRLSPNGENLALIPFVPRTTEFTDYRLGFDASWEIDLAGKTRHDVEAAAARLGSSAETRNAARLVVAADVADAFVDYYASSERLEIAQRTLGSYDETLRLVALEDVRASPATRMCSARRLTGCWRRGRCRRCSPSGKAPSSSSPLSPRPASTHSPPNCRCRTVYPPCPRPRRSASRRMSCAGGPMCGRQNGILPPRRPRSAAPWPTNSPG